MVAKPKFLGPYGTWSVTVHFIMSSHWIPVSSKAERRFHTIDRDGPTGNACDIPTGHWSFPRQFSMAFLSNTVYFGRHTAPNIQGLSRRWRTLYDYFLRTFRGLLGPCIWRQRTSILIYQLAWRNIPEDSNLPSDNSWQFATITTHSHQLRNSNQRCFAQIRHSTDKHNTGFISALTEGYSSNYSLCLQHGLFSC
jgi:hypothetical protein